MENIRKKSLKAYILLESMVAMTLLIFLVTFVLDQVIQVKKQTHEENRKIEALNVALMAVDIGEERLKINDVEVFIEESTSKIVVWESGKVLITLEKKKTF
ncbi:competence type IV pilus minor pilin ComGE [Lactococcus muris]|uniref:Competence type IV pilus minor pilin ComGE n=1 Tax=Lactococcus muris TaxID=2941330 RepID=A0ABV4D5W9_9LACT|nr:MULTISPECIES: competence type IV pilus minor pilin ComGE [Lactococcus]